MGAFWSNEEKALRDALTISNRQDIVLSWIKTSSLNINYFPLDIIDVIMTYSNRIFKFEYQQSDIGYFTTAIDGLSATKSKASNWLGMERRNPEAEPAGIYFGGILRDEMKYYCVIKCFGSYDIAVALQDTKSWLCNELTGPLCYRFIDCYVRVDDSLELNHLLKVTVDMKSKVLTLFNQTTQKTIDTTFIDMDQCKICFLAIHKWTKMQVVEQGWL